MATQTITRYSRITLEIQPPVVRISLQNSPLNIIDIPMMEELSQALAEIESHHDIPVVVLAGSGKAFYRVPFCVPRLRDKGGHLLTPWSAEA